ncbi:hypothetical protein CFOL_v3_06846, partial [Cephalotus follicularis]
WISLKLGDRLKADPNMRYELMEEMLTSQYGVKLSKHQLYRAKQFAKEMYEGNHAKSCSYLYKYAEMISPLFFKRIFFCFYSVKVGFLKGCRPFLGLDGCHLIGPFGGVLLVVVFADGDIGFFPVAYADIQ